MTTARSPTSRTRPAGDHAARRTGHDGGGSAPVKIGTVSSRPSGPFIARHTSTGPCDPGFIQTLTVSQSSNVVVLDIETVVDQPSGAPSDVACSDVGSLPRPDPGAPAARTITLDDPLGARVVVDEHGIPFAVTH